MKIGETFHEIGIFIQKAAHEVLDSVKSALDYLGEVFKKNNSPSLRERELKVVEKQSKEEVNKKVIEKQSKEEVNKVDIKKSRENVEMLVKRAKKYLNDEVGNLELEIFRNTKPEYSVNSDGTRNVTKTISLKGEQWLENKNKELSEAKSKLILLSGIDYEEDLKNEQDLQTIGEKLRDIGIIEDPHIILGYVGEDELLQETDSVNGNKKPEPSIMSKEPESRVVESEKQPNIFMEYKNKMLNILENKKNEINNNIEAKTKELTVIKDRLKDSSQKKFQLFLEFQHNKFDNEITNMKKELQKLTELTDKLENAKTKIDIFSIEPALQKYDIDKKKLGISRQDISEE